MKGMGLKITPVIGRCLLCIQVFLGLWLALPGLIASPNSPNKGPNPPPSSHSPLLWYFSKYQCNNLVSFPKSGHILRVSGLF